MSAQPYTREEIEYWREGWRRFGDTPAWRERVEIPSFIATLDARDAEIERLRRALREAVEFIRRADHAADCWLFPGGPKKSMKPDCSCTCGKFDLRTKIEAALAEGGASAGPEGTPAAPRSTDPVPSVSGAPSSAPAAPEKTCETCGGKGHVRARLGEGCVEHHLHDDQCQRVCCSACAGRGKA